MKDYVAQLLKTKERALRRENKLKDRLAQVKLKTSVKRKQKSLKSLRNELWRVTSRIVRSQSPNCYTCDTYIPIMGDRHAGHHWSQGAHGIVRFDFRNIRTQCYACNVKKSGNQADYAYKLRKELGEEQYEDLFQLKNKTHKWNDRGVLIKMIEERKLILQQYERD